MEVEKKELMKEIQKMAIELLIKHEELKQRAFSKESMERFLEKTQARLDSIERILKYQKRLTEIESEKP